jgi:hypothetical protein
MCLCIVGSKRYQQAVSNEGGTAATRRMGLWANGCWAESFDRAVGYGFQQQINSAQMASNRKQRKLKIGPKRIRPWGKKSFERGWLRTRWVLGRGLRSGQPWAQGATRPWAIMPPQYFLKCDLNSTKTLINTHVVMLSMRNIKSLEQDNLAR